MYLETIPLSCGSYYNFACRPSHHHHSVTIPKRGDKQFEPTGQGESSLAKETNLQQKVLERAREAMFTTLRAERTISRYASHFPFS